MNSLGYEESAQASSAGDIQRKYTAKERSAIVAQMLLQRKAEHQATGVKSKEIVRDLMGNKNMMMQKKELNTDFINNLKQEYTIQKEFKPNLYDSRGSKEIQKDEVYFPTQRIKTEARVEDRLIAYKKNHKNWVVQEKFKKKSKEADKLMNLIKTKSHKEHKSSNIPHRRIETSPEAVI